MAAIAILADDHPRAIAAARQQRGQAEIVVRVTRLRGRHALTRQPRAQRREQPVKRLRAVGVELLEGDAVGEERVEKRRDAAARDRAADEATIETLDEQQQDIRPPCER